jgi:hypothetical protein
MALLLHPLRLMVDGWVEPVIEWREVEGGGGAGRCGYSP